MEPKKDTMPKKETKQPTRQVDKSNEGAEELSQDALDQVAGGIAITKTTDSTAPLKLKLIP